MTANDQIVLNALGTDLTATLALRAMSYRLAQDTPRQHPHAVPTQFFWDEWRAIEQFLDDHFNNTDSRFHPSI